jgi:hypothetical protein
MRKPYRSIKALHFLVSYSKFRTPMMAVNPRQMLRSTSRPAWRDPRLAWFAGTPRWPRRARGGEVTSVPGAWPMMLECRSDSACRHSLPGCGSI